MITPSEIDSFLAGLPPMSEADAVGTLLAFLEARQGGTSTANLRLFRDGCLRVRALTSVQKVMFEVVDGILALRDSLSE